MIPHLPDRERADWFLRQCICLTEMLGVERALLDRLMRAVLSEDQEDLLSAVAAYWAHRDSCSDSV